MCIKRFLTRLSTLTVLVMMCLVLLWQSSLAQDETSSLAQAKQKLWQEEMLPTVGAVSQATASHVGSPSATGNSRDWWGTVYQSARDGNWEIYLRGDKIGDSRLTNNGSADTQPRLSPDALSVLFVSDRDGNSEIYVMNRDGTGQTRLTFEAARDSSPYWSPDGLQIVFASARDGNNEIYTMRRDGSNLRRLTADGASDFHPSWSPDGTRIAWIRATGQSTGSLFVINSDGSNQHPILTDKQYIEHPVWSPDSTQIGFDYDASGDHFNELAIIQANGAGLTTPDMGLAYYSYWADHWMGSWSPDGDVLNHTFIQWTVDEKQRFYIDFGQIRSTCRTGEPCGPFIGTSGMSEYSPDQRLLDGLSPVTQVNPLPGFMRRATGAITWGGADRGIAGILNYDVQYRLDSEQIWHDWIVGTVPSDPNMPENPVASNEEFEYATTIPTNGKILLRSRANDQADNMEPWPTSPSGDAQTIIYSYKLSGAKTDSRGIAVSNQSIPLSPPALLPVQSNLNGGFSTYITDDGQYSLDNTLSLNIQEDTTRSFYLLPKTDLIENGNFEAASSPLHWTFSGEFTPTVDANSSFRGANTLHLGQQCDKVCLSDIEVPTSIRNGASGSMSVIATDGTLHLLSITSGLVHQLRTPDGIWQPYTYLVNGTWSLGLGAAIDDNGTLHVVWSVGPMFGDTGKVYYISRSSKGIWSTSELLGEGTVTSIVVDPSGTLHAFYLCQVEPVCRPYRLQYRRKNKTGGWSSESTVATGTYMSGAQVFASKDGTLHVAWMDMVNIESHSRFFYRLQYKTRSPSGSWSATQLLHSSYGLGNGYEPFGNIVLFGDRLSTLHLFWAQSNQGAILHMQKNAGEAWNSPELMRTVDENGGISGFYFAADFEGTMHILAPRDNQQSPIYWQRQEGQSWQEKQIVSGIIQGEHQQWFANIIPSNSNLLLVFRQPIEPVMRLIALNSSAQTGTSAISQQVTIPSNSHKPTLAFMYQTVGNSDDGASFNVQISEAITQTHNATETAEISETVQITLSQVFTDTTVHNWQLGWIDMEPWQGKTVTVTFALSQPVSGDSYHVHLDDISLGNWETPVVTQALPSYVDFGQSTILTIHGTNFMKSPTVRLGSQQLNSVRWIDENTLEATVPATLSAAVYDVWVTNPGKAESVLAGAFSVGKQTYLPIISR